MTVAVRWPSVPLPYEDVERAVRPFGQARMPPSRAYTDPGVLGWELRHLFAGSWRCLGRLDELFTDGITQCGRQVGTVPVLLTRNGDGVAAFANTCRHRGHELLADGAASNLRVVECPYHAWTYTVDGALRTAPRFRRDDGFTPADYGLVPLPVSVWHGWIFVNASADAAPFGDYLGAMAELVAPYAPERLVLGARHEYDVRANWKVIVENYQEPYPF